VTEVVVEVIGGAVAVPVGHGEEEEDENDEALMIETTSNVVEMISDVVVLVNEIIVTEIEIAATTAMTDTNEMAEGKKEKVEKGVAMIVDTEVRRRHDLSATVPEIEERRKV
jgi:hypothetical protein